MTKRARGGLSPTRYLVGRVISLPEEVTGWRMAVASSWCHVTIPLGVGTDLIGPTYDRSMSLLISESEFNNDSDRYADRGISILSDRFLSVQSRYVSW